MLTRAVGIFAWLMFAVGFAGIILIVWNRNSQPKVTGNFLPLFPMPALALEFAKNGQQLDEIIRDIGNETVREKMQGALRGDSFFITLYLLLFVGIALVLGQRGGVWIVVAAVAVACAIGAAAFDGMENLAMARAIELRSTEEMRPAEAADTIPKSATMNIATPGLLKWVMSFVCVALLSFTFWGRGFPLAWIAFGLCLSIAVLGLAGLMVLRSSPQEFRLVQFAFLALLLLALLVGVAFIGRPHEFERADAGDDSTPVARQSERHF